MKKGLSHVASTIKETLYSVKTKLTGGKGRKKIYHSRTYGKATRGSQRQNYMSRGVAGENNSPRKTSVTPRKQAVSSSVYGNSQRKSGMVPITQKTENTKKKFSFNFGFASKKRFSMIVSGALAAILIPVVVVSANTGATNTIPENTMPVADFTIDLQTDQLQQKTVTPSGTLLIEEGVNTASAVSYSEESADIETDDTTQVSGTVGEIVADVQTNEGQIVADDTTQVVEEDPYLTLEPNTNHDDVLTLQQRLMDLHYMEVDATTDFYGPATQMAVSYFQRKHGLPVDGAAGPATQDLLFSDQAKEYSVTIGGEGLDVENIQGRLQELGYISSVTGYFGEETAAAVEYFQRMNGLTDDGSVGYYTKELLFSQQAVPSLEYNAPAEDSSSGSSSGSGSSGSSSGGSSSGGGSTSAPSANPGSVEAFISAALAQVGDTYVLGGKGPDVFDCSGLIYYALNQAGNSVGYMTSSGWANSGYASVSWDQMQRGDIICIPGHVAIYLGDGQVVEASTNQGAVVVRSGSWLQGSVTTIKRPL